MLYPSWEGWAIADLTSCLIGDALKHSDCETATELTRAGARTHSIPEDGV